MSLAPRHSRIGDFDLWSLSDGHFYPTPKYFGDDVGRSDRAGLFTPPGSLADLPIGCFLLAAPGDRLILVDIGLGADATKGYSGEDDEYLRFTSGELPGRLAGLGVTPADITDVVLTHLHLDHYGWLLDGAGREMFTAAHFWLGRDDYRYFAVERRGGMDDAQRDHFGSLRHDGRLELVRDATVTGGIRLRHTPGHTPGHHSVEIRSGGVTVLLLGDAMTCPEQLVETAWHSVGDIDPEQAEATREALWADLARPGTWGVGAHFPQLMPGAVVLDGERRWLPRPQAGER